MESLKTTLKPIKPDEPEAPLLEEDLTKAYNYGDILTQQTVQLQDTDEEGFRAFSLEARLLEQLVNGKALPEGTQEDREAKFYQVVTESKYRRNLTFALYRCLKTALNKKNANWIQFLTEKLSLDISQDKFIDLLHHFVTQVATKERNAYRAGQPYPDLELDLQITQQVLNCGVREALLTRQDESYGNTLLHLACSLHSIAFVHFLLQTKESDRQAKNTIGKTPEEIIDNEIAAYEGFVPSEDVNRVLSRLKEIKSLFI
ncbi:hypothetical protein FGO68_gene16039 [Halteria grandinella]|uniref:Ankyrin repeat domain-containing protein n=1 Tax=Halteria grandinella TaxID=5974 RepID=A0A8J8SVK9_HALGN|nr:hypothetical protein FGO68_gene16039 [Halteria grandinella]